MFPDVTFLGLELYDWCIIIGVVLALVVARIYSDLLKIPARLQNLIYVTAVVAIVAGIGGAILFQSVYNWIETGVFEWRGMAFSCSACSSCSPCCCSGRKFPAWASISPPTPCSGSASNSCAAMTAGS